MLDTIKELVFNLDTSLAGVITSMGVWTYFLLFAIVFSETGLLFMTFLPGDTLLFAVGAIAAKADNNLDIFIVNIVLVVAAVSGNMLNYFIGYRYGRRIIESGKMPFFKPDNVRAAEVFYNKYGAPAVIFSRFFPIVRTFVPFVAGIGKMNWLRYMIYNIIGALLWIVTLTFTGYFFGGSEFVKNNLTYIILLLMILPFAPLIFNKLMKKSK
ncbi:MAG: VTT domain-containing protein [Chitinophagales bacterium]|nr:VTT domain-containing protein [Chitinophagales bacterium]